MTEAELELRARIASLERRLPAAYLAFGELARRSHDLAGHIRGLEAELDRARSELSAASRRSSLRARQALEQARS